MRFFSVFKTRLMILVDWAKSRLYGLELEIKAAHPDQALEMVLTYINNQYRKRSIFEYFDVAVVYHAAAYGHVPIVENNPREAILVNKLDGACQ